MGGDLAASALENAYYPQSNRGAGLVFGHFALNTAERVVSSLAQEFILPQTYTEGEKFKLGHYLNRSIRYDDWSCCLIPGGVSRSPSVVLALLRSMARGTSPALVALATSASRSVPGMTGRQLEK